MKLCKCDLRSNFISSIGELCAFHPLFGSVCVLLLCIVNCTDWCTVLVLSCCFHTEFWLHFWYTEVEKNSSHSHWTQKLKPLFLHFYSILYIFFVFYLIQYCDHFPWKIFSYICIFCIKKKIRCAHWLCLIKIIFHFAVTLLTALYPFPQCKALKRK